MKGSLTENQGIAQVQQLHKQTFGVNTSCTRSFNRASIISDIQYRTFYIVIRETIQEQETISLHSTKLIEQQLLAKSVINSDFKQNLFIPYA